MRRRNSWLTHNVTVVAAFKLFCRRAVRTGHASAAHRGLGRAIGRGAVWRGSGLPCGQRAACESTGDGRERGRRPCLRAPPHSPASRVCSSGGAQPRPPSTLPACAGTHAPTAPCVPAPARLSGRPLPAWHSLPRAPHGTPAYGATAFGVARLRVPCAPSAAETAAAPTQQGRPAGRPQR